MKEDKLKKYYQKEEVTDSYDKQRLANEYRKTQREKELMIFLRLIDKKPRGGVLELGCSSGHLTKHLGTVTAIDTSKAMLKQAKLKNPKAKVLKADMFRLPFKDNSFKKVVTMRVWNHLDKEGLSKAIKESRRVLKNKGVLIFDIEEKNYLRKIVHFFYKKIFRTTGYKIYQYSLEELNPILWKVGFQVEKEGYLRHRVGRQIIVRARKY